jgi:nucleoside phosphorylase
MNTKLPLRNYTVGWVSILEPELNAARCLLDEEHEHYVTDNYAYILGQMGEHNVVLCNSSPGTVEVSRMTANMVRTFQNIRIVLMVGVGGGVPKRENNDIFLGDVVVSEPRGNHGKPTVPLESVYRITGRR